MKKSLLSLLIIFIVLIYNNKGSAQVFNLMQPGGQNVYFYTGIDPVLIIRAGYARSFDIKIFRNLINSPVTFSGDFTLPYNLIDLLHFRVALSMLVRVKSFDKWQILNKIGVLNTATENKIYSGNTISIKESVQFGYFMDKWHVSGEIGYTKNILTLIENTGDYYKAIFFEEARDGWYGTTGGNISIGLQGGYSISENAETALRLFYKRTEGFNAIEGPPFYGTAGLIFYF
ncbi:hypothetical protein IIB79_05095 [candidate division KSB1 bacterium]|nr:hypothetical protein [candidate division KSB1 bacterium]